MSRQGTLTSIRALRDEQEQVLADHSLKAERVISVLRLVMQLMRGSAYTAVAVASGGQLADEPALRLPLVVLYTLIAVVTVVAVFTRKQGDVKASLVMPFILIVTDFGFLAAMGFMASSYDRGVQTELTGIMCAVVLSFSALRLRRIHIVTSAVLAVAVYVAVAVKEAVVRPLPFAFTLVSYAVFTALVLVLSTRILQMFHTLRTRDNLRRFLPKQVADRVERGQMRSLDPVKREVTVLFSDIRDFTSSSEAMDPAAVMRFLDDYFGRMSQVVLARGGTVGKYIGDGMLCFWGVPEEDPQHAEHAVQAALDMRAVVAELNRERAQQSQPPVRIGIGIHTGPVAAGELGGKGEGLHEYTVIGDSVNLASRIEGLTKQHEVDLLVSEATWARLGERFTGRPCGEERVKGRAEPVRVHAVTSRTVAAGSAL
jgi:adenylate cyclase